MEPLKLPKSLVNNGDVMKIMRELNALNDFFISAQNRQPGTSLQMPKTTKTLEQLAIDNKVNLFDETMRTQLYGEMQKLSKQAPKFHISFATEPSPKALEPILLWLRENIHPQILLSVGYQPSIVAGCVLRTSNKIFDMSMSQHLKKQAPLLTRLLAGSINGN
jgi:F0F1-type ATP synthase delta subunit